LPKMGFLFILFDPERERERNRISLTEILFLYSDELLKNHPNIVRYDRFWHIGPYIGFQIEYLPGGSLDNYLSMNSLYDRSLSREKDIVWNFFLDLLIGLCYIHKNRIVHLDIKPANIFLSLQNKSSIPTLKIGDFGISQKMGPECKGVKLKKGDGRYLAPELLEKDREIDDKVDVYSLGITIFEMASDLNADGALWEEVKKQAVVFERRVSPDMATILRRMLCPAEFRIRAAESLIVFDKLQSKAQELGITISCFENTVPGSSDEMCDVNDDSAELENTLNQKPYDGIKRQLKFT